MPRIFLEEHRLERPLMHILFAVIGVLTVAYVYGIAATTFHIIARKDAHLSITQTESKVAQLGLAYYNLSEAITPERGVQLGMTVGDSNAISYATRASRLVFVGGAPQ